MPAGTISCFTRRAPAAGGYNPAHMTAAADRTLRTLAWWYTAGFLGIFLICHTPGLSDDQGRLFGLFRIDPIDDVVHLLSGIAGALIAWRGHRHIPAYFIVIGILYNLDALVGMTMSRGLLDLSVFRLGPGGADFSLTNWLLNLPHIVLATLALIIGIRKPGRSRPAFAM